MRAFVWDPGTRLEPLGDPIAQSPILLRPLAAHQDEALGPPPPPRIASPSEIPADARDYLLVGGQVYLTRRIARRFLAAARRSGAATCVLALEPCVFTRSTTALAGTRDDGERTIYDVWYRARPGAPTDEELRAATPIPLTIREHPVPNDMLSRRGIRADGLEVALTLEAVLHVRHWSHLVTANYVALFCHWFELTPRKVLRYLGAVLRAGVPTRHRLLRALTVRGRRARVHPSAVVEASVLGDDVEVGPHAYVLGSFVGRGAKIDTHANVSFSSIGEGAIVSFNTLCNYSVLYPQSMLGFIGCQLAVLGRRASVLSGTFLMDLRDPYLEQDVLVDDGGARVPSGRRLLGPLIGHEAIVGANVTIAPGLAVPNGAFLVGDPARVLRRVDGELPARVAHFALEGRATPAKKP